MGYIVGVVGEVETVDDGGEDPDDVELEQEHAVLGVECVFLEGGVILEVDGEEEEEEDGGEEGEDGNPVLDEEVGGGEVALEVDVG